MKVLSPVNHLNKNPFAAYLKIVQVIFISKSFSLYKFKKRNQCETTQLVYFHVVPSNMSTKKS